MIYYSGFPKDWIIVKRNKVRVLNFESHVVNTYNANIPSRLYTSSYDISSENYTVNENIFICISRNAGSSYI